jgi:flagellin
MVINTNTSAQSSARLLSDSSSMLSKSLARLSSGSKITSPEDDAAGLAVSTRFDAQVNRLSAANNNVGNAVSFSQTQDGYLQKVGKALDRMSELSVLSQDVTKTDTDRGLYDKEFQKLDTYIDDVAKKDFNGVSLFGSTDLNVTTDSDANTVAMTAVAVTKTSANVTDATAAAAALTTVKASIDTLATNRATVGANISVLSSYSSQLGVLKDNLSSANSRIKDVDVAQESTQYARYNILAA